MNQYGVAFEQKLKKGEKRIAKKIEALVSGFQGNDIRDLAPSIREIAKGKFDVGCGGSHIWLKRLNWTDIWERWAFIGGKEEADGWQTTVKY